MLKRVLANQAVNRTPKAYRFWFPPLTLRRRLPQRLVTNIWFARNQGSLIVLVAEYV